MRPQDTGSFRPIARPCLYAWIVMGIDMCLDMRVDMGTQVQTHGCRCVRRRVHEIVYGREYGDA